MILPLSAGAFISMWVIAFIALIFFKEGDDRRTLLLASSMIIAVLSIFGMMIPTFTIKEYPAYNSIVYNSVVATPANVVSNTFYPAYNVSDVSNTLSNPVITLYSIYAVFQAFIFGALALWSLRRRLQYYTTAEYKQGLGHRRR